MTVLQNSILKGVELLKNPGLNKGTAFTQSERRTCGLEGLLPSNVETLDLQVRRALLNVEKKANDLERYSYLQDLEERNEVVFYKTIMSDPKRFIPVLYDPVVADACLEFGHIYRRPRGMYITHHMQGRIAEVLRNWPVKDVRFICVTTGGRILGLGDIGANGMGIPIGKLQLYTACAGVPPECLLPVLFDIGTTNKALLNDPMYLGLHEEPISTSKLDELTAEFVEAVQEVFPECCIHFEDWKGTDAIRYLDRYKDEVLCYNDDIQGTASIALAGISAALNITGGKLVDQRVLFLGAGSAGLGIAKLIVKEMATEGLSEEEAVKRIRLMDINGLINQKREDLSPAQLRYAHDEPATNDLVEMIERFKPTILFGVSTQAGAFTQQVVEAMSRLNGRPIIFALSNPTSKVECTAEQAYRWSQGKALFAAGVQFPEFSLKGKTFHPGQANNFYIYPAIGLATYAARPKRLTDECFIVAAHATADQISPEMREKGMLYPGQDDILATEVKTAVRVAEYLFDAGLAQVQRPDNIPQWIASLLYKPEY
ncbi:oxaloacetate-decarboxylating malate dehydrogenase [Raoultella sp. Lac2]|uniref:NAD-dependent malic enzyme n=1 Tax=Klebsiella/Raoultella group TaxID=2890311 RepID=UPI00135237AB|nr:oxaloacetate-decarboxylating malate dehydrogenase [Raoultella sp. Lac2]MXF98216.1 oxaloacetate-decarboxylating malate dehydrogenase [Raoultella sp. Lac1]